MARSIERIARSITESVEGNVMNDFYKFYNDGEWIVKNARNIYSVLGSMVESMTNYSVYIAKLEEDVGYIERTDVEELNVSSCVKEMNSKISDIKKKYEEWEKATAGEQAVLSDEYKALVLVLKDYAKGYLDSCVNTFRNRYIEDEENVRKLLDVIHRTGNSVLNNRTSTEK